MSENVYYEIQENLTINPPLSKGVVKEINAWIEGEEDRENDWPFRVTSTEITIETENDTYELDCHDDGLDIDDLPDAVVLARVIKKILELRPEVKVNGIFHVAYAEGYEYRVEVHQNKVGNSHREHYWALPTYISLARIEEEEVKRGMIFGDEGQDHKSYTDDQDHESYEIDPELTGHDDTDPRLET